LTTLLRRRTDMGRRTEADAALREVAEACERLHGLAVTEGVNVEGLLVEGLRLVNACLWAMEETMQRELEIIK
jgi:hypothetical protein